MKMTVKEIRSRVKGLAPTTVLEVTDIGINLVEQPRNRHSDTKVDLENAVKMRAEGKTFKEIGQFYGTTQQNVEALFNYWGLK